MYESTFLEFWILTKDLTIHEIFTQENWLNPDKNSEMCGILTCSMSIPTSSATQKT